MRRVLLIDLDDLGYDLLESAIDYGRANALSRLRTIGRFYERFWAAPWCSLFRARVLTGLDAYRDGNLVGANINLTGTFEAPSGRWITDGMPGRKTKRGKWHLSSSSFWPAVVCRPGGYDEFSGSLANFKSPSSYYDWTKGASNADGSSLVTQNHAVHATNDAFEAALDDVDDEVEFIHASFNAIHKPLLPSPPAGEPPGSAYLGSDTLEQKLDLLQHLDWRMGLLTDQAILADYVVIVACDNGTEDDGKGTMFEDGLRTPLIVAGNGIIQGVSQRMVAATDIWATVRWLRGCDLSEGAADSIYFADDFLVGAPMLQPARRMLTCDMSREAGTPPLPSHWVRAIRDARWKLIDDPTDLENPRRLFDLALDPTETSNLLLGTLTSRQQQAYDRLLAALPTL